MTTWCRRGLPAGGRVSQSVLSWHQRLETSTPHHALSGMEEKDKKEHGEYTGEIKGGLRPSMKLVVMGIINKKPKSMEVTLSSHPQEEEEEGDVGLQLKISFMDKAVQRNARMAGKWGKAENNLSFFPFAAGESFKMEIVCEHQQFRILVDGQPLCGFTHRIAPLASLTALRVFGDLQLTKVA
uniref:Galectin n=2 Tax=Labrus bergylta TaxID=56723 RepID=A0A3Q3FZS8_9LABR|nr:galectin-related protein B-like [Labrus bergylta]